MNLAPAKFFLLLFFFSPFGPSERGIEVVGGGTRKKRLIAHCDNSYNHNNTVTGGPRAWDCRGRVMRRDFTHSSRTQRRTYYIVRARSSPPPKRTVLYIVGAPYTTSTAVGMEGGDKKPRRIPKRPRQSRPRSRLWSTRITRVRSTQYDGGRDSWHTNGV